MVRQTSRREAQQVHEEQERVKRARLAEESQQRYHAATRAGYASRQAARHLRGAWRVAEQLAEQQHQQQHQQERQPQRNEDQDVQQHQHRHQQRDHRQEQVQRVDLAHGGGGNRGGPATAALHVLLERLPTLQMMLQQEIPQQEMHASAGRRTDVKTAAEVEIADTTSALEPGCCGTAVAKPRQACSVDRALMDTEPEPSPADMSATGPATYGQVNGCAPRVVAEPTQPPATTDEKAEEAEAAVEPPSLGAQLELLLLHLRQVHCYCYFCGTAYDGPDDMASHCPGLTEEEH
ncbi:hypothetical protein HYH02_000403 [Chlamydomonas schloesseri]|uniref:DUF4187 domain-containing protein n=1 Tax=Chlamydomonas schloesseri TaxID=2026947 RepID=A0A835WUL0_9CHLO|nr:hypothetical protein HYH02_000403 [Chlamydomonas schloesseri]|eukprot:KAG2454558.1 hypothetical protein HYH02_000403 [Chlamydomonas schloesseri]